MIILQTVGLSKSFGIDSILTDINIQIQSEDRVGLVGVNGAGKSTLLKILAGEILPDKGEIQTAKDTKIGYLAQDSGLEIENTIWNEMISVFSDFKDTEKYIRNLEEKMADNTIIKNKQEYDKLMNEYAKVIEEFQTNGGYTYEAQIRNVLHGLGFQSYNYQNQYIETLSGGEKTRLALAKLLLEKPNLLILDEPTNYLDVETLTWLEGYLKYYSGAILVVSHDRYFLDTLVTTIYEIDNTKAVKYNGNYSKYIEQKAKHFELTMKTYEKQQAEIKKKEDFIQKNIARATTSKRAQSRRKMLEKIEVIDKPSFKQKSTSLTFETNAESGNNVLTVKDLAIAFNEINLFKNVSFSIKKKERVALIGPNGVGKSTLFKILINNLNPDNGIINYGSNVKPAYYDQEQEDLDDKKTIIDEVWDNFPSLNEKEIRTLLGNFLFSGDDVFKIIRDLSGGERARVNLAKLILLRANFLLLDEPTNHLDIYSREALENALLEYNGTILFISHDRYFLNQLTTRTIELTSDGVNNFLGNYDYLLEKKVELEEAAKNQSIKIEKSNKEQYFEERKKQNQTKQLKHNLEEIEKEIERMESEIKEIESELLKPEVYSDYQLSYKKNEKLKNSKESLNQLLEEWESKQQELES